MRGALALFVTLYLLHTLVAEANNALAGLHIWLFAGGLFVTYSALAMPYREGFFASFLGGLLCDSAAPVAFGTQVALFTFAHAVVYTVRVRLQRNATAVRVVVALLVNLAMFAVLCLLRMSEMHLAMWPRLFSDLFWSEAAVAMAAPWFFAFQLQTLVLARAKPAHSA